MRARLAWMLAVWTAAQAFAPHTEEHTQHGTRVVTMPDEGQAGVTSVHVL